MFTVTVLFPPLVVAAVPVVAMAWPNVVAPAVPYMAAVQFIVGEFAAPAHVAPTAAMTVPPTVADAASLYVTVCELVPLTDARVSL